MKIACTFFGHAEAPSSLQNTILEAARRLIEEKGVLLFYVGTHGSFDCMAYMAIMELRKIYPDIECYRVLSRIPTQRNGYSDPKDTLVPDGLENVHGRYSVVHRNRWMIDKSDFVITYVTHSWGGAATFKKIAEGKGKTVINLI